MKFTYTIECDNGKDDKDSSGPFTARMINPDDASEETPFVAEGDTPILALGALGEVCKDWNAGGAHRWCSSADGQEHMERIAKAIEWAGRLH